MRLILVAISGMLLSFAAFADPDCSAVLTGPFEVEPTQSVVRSELSFGDPVKIRLPDGRMREAYYLGVGKDRAFFAPTEAAGLKRPIFYLPVQDVSFHAQTIVAPGASVLKPLSIRPLPVIDFSSEPDVCAPQTVMGCLTHLEQMGLLKGLAKSELLSHRTRLFEEMTRSFSRDAIAATDEGRAMIADLENAPNRKSSRRLAEKMREYAFARVTSFLTSLGVATEVTSSYRKLIRHLSAGKPAYVSVGGTTVSMARPHLNEWNSTLDWDHPDIRGGTVPMPQWAPSFSGFHAVYALGALPRAAGINGFLRGRRIVVLDPANGELNVWDTFLLRFAGQSKFILIEP